MKRRIAYSVLFIGLFSDISDATAKSERHFQVLDALRQQTLGDLAWSPDGEVLAYTVRRSAAEETTKPVDFYWDKSRDTIRLWGRRSGKAIQLVLPGSAAAGAWDLSWSHDGAYLAFLSDVGGIINLWVWDREEGTSRQVTTDGVGWTGCEWSNGTDMVCAVSDTGEYLKPNYPAGGSAVGAGIDAVRAAWASAERGEMTASVIDSMSFPNDPHTVFRVSVETGEKQTIGSAFSEYRRSGDFVFKQSPNRDHLVVRSDSSTDLPRIFRWRTGHPAEIAILRRDGTHLELDTDLPSDVLLRTVRWSPDGRYLGFLALNGKPLHKQAVFQGKWEPFLYPDVRSREHPAEFYIIDVQARTLHQLDTRILDFGSGARPPEFHWRGSNRVMFYTVLREERMTGARPRWITLDRTGDVSEIDDELAGLSARLVLTRDGGLIGIVEDRLVRIDPDGQLTRVQHDGHEILAVRVSETSSAGQAFAYTDLAFGSGYSIDLLDNSVDGPYRVGSGFPRFSAFSGEVFAYTEFDGGVEHLKVSTRSGVQTVSVLSEHMRQVGRFKQQVFTYTSANGNEAKGIITLPYGYSRKRLYPTVFDSDIGYGVHGQAGRPSLYEVQDDGVVRTNAATFAAAGYVYVFLSMPTNELDDVGRANLLSLTSGILPGVDWLVREGIADPDRLFLFGESSMGYGALGLITQTSRFKAAISAFGFTDPAKADDLGLSVHQRYSPAAFDEVTGDGIYLLQSDRPSYLQGEDYRRNTPMTYVDRVVTPLMIVAGDMDRFALSEEPFFAALVLRRVPARFVRYWGVGHGPRGVENTLDYYARMVRWFDYWGAIQRDEIGEILWSRNRVEAKAEQSMESLAVYRSYPLFNNEVATN